MQREPRLPRENRLQSDSMLALPQQLTPPTLSNNRNENLRACTQSLEIAIARSWQMEPILMHIREEVEGGEEGGGAVASEEAAVVGVASEVGVVDEEEVSGEYRTN